MYQVRWKCTSVSGHFKHIIEILLSYWLNINENWHTVKSYQERTSRDIKWSNKVTEIWKLGRWLNLGWGIQLLRLFFKSQMFINYSYKDDMLSFWYHQGHINWKFVGWLNFVWGIQLWHSFFKLTKSSLRIDIIMTCCHFGIKRGSTKGSCQYFFCTTTVLWSPTVTARYYKHCT